MIHRPIYRDFSSPDDAILEGFDLAQPKLDGWFCQVVFGSRGAAIYSREGNLLEMRATRRPIRSAIAIGEYMSRSRKRGLDSSGYRDHGVVLFDVVEIDGAPLDTGYFHRLDLCTELAQSQCSPPILAMCTYRDLPITVPHLEACYIAHGGEGLIFRRSDAPFDHPVGRWVVPGYHERRK
jgi:hypothetical protein